MTLAGPVIRPAALVLIPAYAFWSAAMSILVIESIASVASIAGKARMAQPRPSGWHADFMTAKPGGKAAVAGSCPALLAGGTVTGVVVILWWGAQRVTSGVRVTILDREM